MLAVDTNVLVYAADADSQFHSPCRDWLERQRVRPDAWYTTWAILYEFLRVTTHPRVMRRPWGAPAAWQFVTTLLASPGFGILVPTQRHVAQPQPVEHGEGTRLQPLTVALVFGRIQSRC